MAPARHGQYQDGAGYGSDDDRPESGFDDVQAKHQPHAGGNEEETHVGNQEVAQAFYPFEPYPFQFQEKRQQEHSHDASRKGDAREVDEKFAQGQATEQYRTLEDHHDTDRFHGRHDGLKTAATGRGFAAKVRKTANKTHECPSVRFAGTARKRAKNLWHIFFNFATYALFGLKTSKYQNHADCFRQIYRRGMFDL